MFIKSGYSRFNKKSASQFMWGTTPFFQESNSSNSVYEQITADSVEENKRKALEAEYKINKTLIEAEQKKKEQEEEKRKKEQEEKKKLEPIQLTMETAPGDIILPPPKKIQIENVEKKEIQTQKELTINKPLMYYQYIKK